MLTSRNSPARDAIVRLIGGVLPEPSDEWT